MKYILLLFFMVGGCSQQSNVVKASIVDYGLVKSAGSEEEKHYSKPDLVIRDLTDIKIVKTTSVIPLEKDIQFGIEMVIEGITEKNNKNFILLIEHPKMILPSGNPRNRVELTINPIKNYETHKTVIAYELTREHEMVAGNWKFSLLNENVVLDSINFRIVNKN